MIDMQEAREICGRVKGYEDPDGGNRADFQAAMMLSGALDEIDRLREALVEERAFSMSAAASCPGGSPDCYGIDWEKVGKDKARQQLESEGKL